VTDALRAALRLGAWVAGLLIAARVTLALGSGDLGVPLNSMSDLTGWVEQASPATLAMALLRLAVLVGIGYLLLATLLSTLAEIVHLRPLTAVAERVTPRLVRRIAQGGGGVGLALGAIAGTLPLPDSGPDRPQTTIAAPGPDVATMSRAPGSEATMASAVAAPASTATMARSDPPAPSPDLPSAPITTTPPPTPGGSETWIVEAGDSFWSIAEDVVGPGDERVLRRYWRALIVANRSRLADPQNPDLLIPGQELVLVPP
jgi:LysM domain